jgi:hypothetical protein
MADEERTGSCPLCYRRDPREGAACDPCRNRLAAALWEIRDLHTLLGAALSPGQSGGQRVSGSREAPLPLSVRALDLAGPARREVEGVSDAGRDQAGGWSVAAILDSWARDWAPMLDEPLPRPDVPALVSWLSRHLKWALDEHPAVDDFNHEVIALLYGLRSLLNVSRQPIYLTDPCPSCAHTALKRDPGGGDVECGHCHRTWPHTQFERLAVVLADDGDAA